MYLRKRVLYNLVEDLENITNYVKKYEIYIIR